MFVLRCYPNCRANAAGGCGGSCIRKAGCQEFGGLCTGSLLTVNIIGSMSDELVSDLMRCCRALGEQFNDSKSSSSKKQKQQRQNVPRCVMAFAAA